MSTLLITHSASLPTSCRRAHPECPERMLAVQESLAAAVVRRADAREAPTGRLDDITLCHSDYYVNELQHIAPDRGARLHRRRHLDVAWHLGSGDARGRRRRHRRRRGDGRQGRQRVLAMRPPGHHAETVAADGLLLLRQRRDRRPLRAEAGTASRASRWSISTSTTATARRTSSGPTGRDVLLDPRDAALSRHRRGRRKRRPQHHRQRATARRRRRRAVPRGVRDRDPAAARRRSRRN